MKKVNCLKPQNVCVAVKDVRISFVPRRSCLSWFFCHVTKGIQDRRIEWILNEEVGDLVEVSGLIKLFIMNIRQHLVFSY